MSTELLSLTLDNGSLHLTRFFGGRARGPMVQLTIGNEYVQLTPAQATQVAEVLANALRDLDRPFFFKAGGGYGCINARSEEDAVAKVKVRYQVPSAHIVSKEEHDQYIKGACHANNRAG